MSQYIPNVDNEMPDLNSCHDLMVRKINIFCAMLAVGASVNMATRSSKAGFPFFHIAIADLLPTIGNVLHSIDTPVSCDIQGFLRNWGTLTTFFFICHASAMIMIHVRSFRTINHQKTIQCIKPIQHWIDKLCQKKELLQKKRFSVWIWLTTLFISVIPFMVDGYNPTKIESWCWIQPGDTLVVTIGGMKLEKQKLNTILRFACFYGWLLATFLWLVATYLVINCCAPYDFGELKNVKIWFSRIVACNLFILTIHWSFPMVRRVYNALYDGQDFDTVYFDSCVIQAIFVDLHGVGNALGCQYIIYQYNIVFGQTNNDINVDNDIDIDKNGVDKNSENSITYSLSSSDNGYSSSITQFSHFSTSSQLAKSCGLSMQ